MTTVQKGVEEVSSISATIPRNELLYFWNTTLEDQIAVARLSFRNLSRYRSPAMDELLAAFRAEPTEANRREVLRQLGEDAPVVPLIHGQAVAVYSSRISGFRPSPIGRSSLSRLRFMK